MEKELNKIKNKLILEHYPKAIGIFGSGAKEIVSGKDIDLYVLKNNFYRDVFRGEDNIYEIYFGETRALEKAIDMKNVEIIDRFRNSKIIYDPKQIYQSLIERAKNQTLAKEGWREETIIGGNYDLVERTKEYVGKSIREGKLESAVSSLQSLTNRVLDVGFRRVNESGYANPKNIPSLVEKHFPSKMNDLYKQIAFSDLRDVNKIKEIIECFEKHKLKLLPKK